VKTVNDLLRDQHQAVEGGIKHEHHHDTERAVAVVSTNIRFRISRW
jgi:hypothetical protein